MPASPLVAALSSLGGRARALAGSAIQRLAAPVRAAAKAVDWRANQPDHVEPRVRTYDGWTLSAVRGAYNLAESGDLRRAAELCEAMLADDRLRAVLDTRVNAVLGADLSFEQGAGRKRRAAAKAIEAGEDWWIAFPDSELHQTAIWGLLLGVSPGQFCYRTHADHGGRDIGALETWWAGHLRQDVDRGRQWFIRTGRDGFAEVPIHPGAGKWFLFTPFGTNRPWSLGLWRGLARLWLLKQFAIDDWGLHSELHGQGWKVAKPAERAPTPAAPPRSDALSYGMDGDRRRRQELANDIYALRKDGVLVLPPGFDFELVTMPASNAEVFEKQISMVNSAYAVTVLGSNLPTEVQGNAGTGATAQHLVRVDYNKALASYISSATHDQWGVHWAEINFDDRSAAPWPVYDVEPKADLKARAETLKTLGEAMVKMLEAGAPLDVEALAEEFGVPLQAAQDIARAALLLKVEADFRREHPGAPRIPVAKLSTVWSRGHELGGDRWAVGRVKAFLRGAAGAGPVVDQDLLS